MEIIINLVHDKLTRFVFDALHKDIFITSNPGVLPLAMRNEDLRRYDSFEMLTISLNFDIFNQNKREKSNV